MTQGIGHNLNNFSIGAGYYSGDSFPGSSARRSEVRGFAIFDQPGGSIRDDAVIDCCNKYGMTMCFTHMRLFHH